MPLALFLLAWFIFTFGPGVAITGRLTRDLDPLRRLIVALGVGSAMAPVLIDLLGRLNLVPAFPYLAVALAIAGLSQSRRRSMESPVRTAWHDVAACAALVALAGGLGTLVFAHRIESTPAGIVLYGDYDSADMSYYAAEASEASHTVPPMASYYSGHRLNAAYYPQLVPAMIHRFAAIPVLSIYFRYLWPTFLALGALTAFALVRCLAPIGVALLAPALILVAGDFSYLAAWFLPHATYQWDYVLWPANFLSATMEVLQFNTWGPSFPVFFTALYTIVRGIQTRGRGWLLLSAIVIAVLFEFKPFAYAMLMAALGAAAVFSGRDWQARWHFAATLGLGVLFTLPFLVESATLEEGDRRTRLVLDLFLLPKRMLLKLDLADAFARAAHWLAPWPWLGNPLFLLLATTMFLLVGIGIRWLGAPGVWRAIRGQMGQGPDATAWRLLGWIVVAGVAIPCVLATEPYVDTPQFYYTGLYVMWIFAASAMVGFVRKRREAGAVAIAVAIALALPSSMHYLERRWTDRQRPPRVGLSASDIRIAEYLRTKTDPETTVILHDRPLSPSLLTIVAERRIVLGWDVTYSAVGGQDRLRDVNRFFSSASGNPDAAFESLGLYHVTHVLVRDDDRVHPAVLARLHLLMQFPGASLYTVPQTAEP
jgi:hypothetical protein